MQPPWPSTPRHGTLSQAIRSSEWSAWQTVLSPEGKWPRSNQPASWPLGLLGSHSPCLCKTFILCSPLNLLLSARLYVAQVMIRWIKPMRSLKVTQLTFLLTEKTTKAGRSLWPSSLKQVVKCSHGRCTPCSQRGGASLLWRQRVLWARRARGACWGPHFVHLPHTLCSADGYTTAHSSSNPA